MRHNAVQQSATLTTTPSSHAGSSLVTIAPDSPIPPGFLDDIRADFELTRAYLESAEMGTVTPLLKQELRYKIGTRRLSEGRSELPVSEVTSKPDEKLTVDDIRRRIKRQQQNKESTKRMRQREIQREDELRKKLNIKSAENNILRRTRDALQKEKNALLKQLEDIIKSNKIIFESPSRQMISSSSAKSPNKWTTTSPLSAESPNKWMTSPKSTESPNKWTTTSPQSAERPNILIILQSLKSANKK